MSRKRQLGFKLLEFKNAKFFGGSHLKNSHAKVKRPLAAKKPLHLVVRSSKATGAQSLLRHQRRIFDIVSHQAKLAHVKVYRYANAGNHLHLIVLAPSRESYSRFVRSMTGLIARFILKAERSNPQKIKFWDQRPYTRVVEWGRDFQNVSRDLLQNTLEAVGFAPYKPRATARPITQIARAGP